MSRAEERIGLLSFVDTVEGLDSTVDLTVIIERSFENTDALWDFLKKQLAFPDYFGRNWNAFYDCVSTASFYLKKNICLIHACLPLSDARELYLYLSCLADATKQVPINRFSLQVIFPMSLYSEIHEVLELADQEKLP
jgi:hypothetical protein